jgi:lactate dehydrogenase-like 2-hydroxyacid dehydrogenase
MAGWHFVVQFEQGEIGTDLLRKACEFGLEVMVCKRSDRPDQASRSKQVEALDEGEKPQASATERVMDALA